MTLFSILALLPAIIIGFNVVSLFWPEGIFHHLLLKLTLGIGAGVGVTSSFYFFFQLLFPLQDHYYFIIEIFLIIISSILLLKFKMESFGFLKTSIVNLRWSKWIIPLTIVLFFVIVSSFQYFLTFSLANPHGYYDAFSIWNLHARMIFRGAEYWTEGFSPSLYHADYPLLIPASIARVWSMGGRESFRTPMIFSGLFLYATIALLSFSLSHFHKYLFAFLSAIILLSTSNYLLIGSSQYADIPLAFFFLAGGLCLLLYIAHRQNGFLFLCALFSGFAGWTKNEGLLLLFAMSLVLFYNFVSQKRAFPPSKFWLAYLGGLALPVLSIILFKILLAPQNDLFIDQNLSIIIKNVTSFDRYITIVTKLLFWAGETWQIPTIIGITLMFFSFGTARIDNALKSAFLNMTIVLFIVIAGYCAIYLVTPWDLVVHLRTSANRLLLHIYPLLLLIVFLLMNTPDDLLLSKTTESNCKNEIINDINN